jgi:hypothetical protein
MDLVCSSAATNHISVVPGLAKHTSTPLPASWRMASSAPVQQLGREGIAG